MPKWEGYPGGHDRLGLLALCHCDPLGKFDWYEIGGRFQGALFFSRRRRSTATVPELAVNTIVASELLRLKDFAKRLPFTVVTPHGEWIERCSFQVTESGWFVREEARHKWLSRVRTILRTFSDRRVVCVDAHS